MGVGPPGGEEVIDKAADERRKGRVQGRRPTHVITAERIVTRAFQLVDEHGHDRFSIRLLARELGVYPATIYWHVGDRRRLLGMIDALWMHNVMPSAEGMSWIDWLRAMAHAYRRASHDHPNIARLVASELVNDPTVFTLPEAIVAQLELGGFPPAEMVHAYNAMVGATIGFVDLEFARDPVRSDEERQQIEADIRAIDPARYPALARHLDTFADRAFSLRWTAAAQAPLDESFAYLVDLIADGLQRRASSTDPG
jgi:AcrR family transcriptional regulator